MPPPGNNFALLFQLFLTFLHNVCNVSMEDQFPQEINSHGRSIIMGTNQVLWNYPCEINNQVPWNPNGAPIKTFLHW